MPICDTFWPEIQATCVRLEGPKKQQRMGGVLVAAVAIISFITSKERNYLHLTRLYLYIRMQLQLSHAWALVEAKTCQRHTPAIVECVVAYLGFMGQPQVLKDLYSFEPGSSQGLRLLSWVRCRLTPNIPALEYHA